MTPGLTALDNPKPPFQPSGNEIWDEIQQAHGQLSPLAQKAVALSGVPQQAAAAESAPTPQPAQMPITRAAQQGRPLPDLSAGAPAPAVLPSKAPAETPNMSVGEPPAIGHAMPEPVNLPSGDSIPASMPSPMGPATPSPLQSAQSEYGRLAGSGSGIHQVKNGFARHALEVLDALGSFAAPGITANLPGTELHHQQLLGHQKDIVNQNESEATAEENRKHLTAEAAELGSRGINEQSEADTRNAELPGAMERTAAETANLKSEAAERSQPKPLHTIHALPDGTVVGITSDPSTGKDTAEVLYKGDPKVETDLADLQVNGKPHKVIVNKRDGTVIKDLGEAGKTAATGSEDRRSDQSYQFNIGELNKLGKPIEDLGLRLGRLNDTIEQNSPQADALVAPELLTVMAGGMGSGLRMNEAEIARIVGGRSKWETLKASINKWQLDPKQALSITPEQRQDIRALVKTVNDKLGAKQSILDDARTALLNAQSAEEHRRIVSEAHRKVTAVDQGVKEDAGTPVNPDKATYDALPKGAAYTWNGVPYTKR